MPRDLFAESNAAPQPVDLLAGGASSVAQPTGSTTNNSVINILSRIGRGAAAGGLGFLEGVSESGQGIADLGDRLINMLAGTHLKAPKGNLFALTPKLEQLPEATVGKFVGEAAPAIATGGLVSEGLIPQALATGATAFATQPGGIPERTIAGGLGIAGGGLAHLLTKGSMLFVKPLAKKLEKLYAAQKNIGNDLYKDAFSGTEDVTPVISNATQQSFENLSTAWPGKTNAVTKAVNRYNQDQTIENLHTLKSDLGKLQSKLSDKSIKSGLTGDEIDKQSFLSDAINNLEKDTHANLTNIDPNKGAQYAVAQSHWRDNVVPFREYTSLKKLFGPDREVDPRLYTDLGRQAESAQKLRKLLKINNGTLATGKFLHQKLWGIPMPVYLGMLGAGGYGLYGLRRRLLGGE